VWVLEMNEQEDLDLLEIVAYPFIVHNTSSISAKEFIFSISLDALLCSPSTSLLLLKCGIHKGLLIFDSLKKRVSATFDYNKIKVISYSRDVDKIIKMYCNDAVKCCNEISSLNSLSALISLQTSSSINSPRHSSNFSEKSKGSVIHVEKDLLLKKKENHKKKRNKSKRSNHGTSSLEDYF